jgi:hypothetical protein
MLDHSRSLVLGVNDAVERPRGSKMVNEKARHREGITAAGLGKDHQPVETRLSGTLR